MRTRRFYKITKTLLTYGLDDLIPRSLVALDDTPGRHALFWMPNRHKDKPAGVRLRLALEQLGPVWVKFGQMLSTRRDLLPPDIAIELARLQDKVPPFDGEAAQKIIEKSLNINSIDECFIDFDTTPLASASIAQVHTAQLKQADEIVDVVIKVIRPDIRRETIHADLELMETLGFCGGANTYPTGDG